MNSNGKKARKASGLNRYGLIHRTRKGDAKRRAMGWTKTVGRKHKHQEE